MANQVRESIIKEYGIRPGELEAYGGDPLLWAQYPDDGEPRLGVEAFRKKYDPDTL